jgi:hypothetical protein
MNTIARAAVSLILFPFLGSIFSCLFALAALRGTFTKWEMLGRPDTTASIKLVRMDYVKSATGDLYKFQYSPECTSNCWVKVETLPPILDALDSLPLENCNDSFDIPSVRRFSDSVIECKRSGTGILLKVQAIDDTGNVQMWRKGHDDFGDPLMLVSSPFLGAIYGLIPAVILTAIVSLRVAILHWTHQRGIR